MGATITEHSSDVPEMPQSSGCCGDNQSRTSCEDSLKTVALPNRSLAFFLIHVLICTWKLYKC